MDLLKEVQAKEMFFSDIYYVALMSKCTELKVPRFAEELAGILRTCGSMMVSAYCALVKVLCLG